MQNSDVRRFDEILAETISNLEARDVIVRIIGDVAIIHAQTTYTQPNDRAGSGRDRGWG
jgi:hypothetical protein